MAEYDAVEGEQYCMPSWQKRNVQDTNNRMGYNNMADRANTPKPPVAMKAAKSDKQLSPKMPNQG